jgi:ribosomal protein S18 acetylase RimI-like enzyme
MEHLRIRKALPGDLVLLRQFEQDLIAAERPFTNLFKPDPIYYYHLEEMLSDPDIDLLLAEIDGEPVASGYARIEQAKHYYRPERQAYLGMMYVVPAYRGKGINSLMMDELKRLLRQRGVTELCLEVFSENQSAIKAYEKAGFKNYIFQMRMTLE